MNNFEQQSTNEILQTAEIVKQRFSRIGLFASAFLMLGNVIAPMLIIYALVTFLKVPIMSLLSGNAMYLITYGGLYLIALPVAYLFIAGVPPMPQIKENNIKYSFSQLVQISVIMLGVNYIFSLLTGLLQEALPFLQDSYDSAIEGMLTNNFLLAFLIVVVIAPIMEEVLFRKMILSRLQGFGDLFAIVACGLFFGLFHCMLTQFFFATAFGIILSYVTLRTGNIKLAVFLHFLNNFISFMLSAATLTLPEATSEKISMAFTFFIIVMIMSAVVLLLRNRQNIVLEKSRITFYGMQPSALFYSSIGVVVYFITSFALTFFATQIVVFLMRFIPFV